MLRVAPCELKEANAFVASLHRHHKPVVGHRFSLKALDGEGVIRGVAIVGRPVARSFNPGEILEVTRLCTDGTRNACSLLYAAAARAGNAMGYKRIQTYLLQDEPGVTCRAAGWRFDGMTAGGQWKRSDGSPRRTDQPTCPKQRWVKDLHG